MLGIGSLILAKQSMMVLITMVVVAGVGLRASASLRSLGRSSQRPGGPYLPPEATTLSHTYHHCSKQRQGWPDHCTGSGTSSAEWKQRNSELVQIAEEPKRAK